jgi:hypothetical protein
MADAATASERGNAHGSAGAENGKFYRSGGHDLKSLRFGGSTEFESQSRRLRPGFGFCSRHSLLRQRLIDFEKRHFQFAEKIDQHAVFFGSEIAFGLFVQGVEHVDQFASGVGIDHGLPGVGVGVGTEYHGGIAAEHADEILECGRPLGGICRGNGCGNSGGGRRCRRRLCGFALGFALFFFDGFRAELTFGGEGAAVDDAERFFVFFVFMVGQGQSSALCTG